MVRAVEPRLVSHICGPVSTSGVDTISGLNLLLVLFFVSRVFFGFSGFTLSLKTNTSKFQFDLECTDTFQRVLKCF